MIYTVKGRSERHERLIEFQAMMHGLAVHGDDDGLQIECHRPDQMLHLISQAGGSIVSSVDLLPMGRDV